MRQALADIQAQIALSKGLTNGTVVEALSYYYQAASYNPFQSETAARLSTLSTEVKSGNIGANVQNDIQRRREWVKVLDEAKTYFADHPPYELIYDPAVKEGWIDYQRELVTLSFTIKSVPTDGYLVIQNLQEGLAATGRARDWELNADVFIRSVTIPANVSISDSSFTYSNRFDRYYNDNGKKAGIYTYDGRNWSMK
ncbi:MAG: hypothetical protein LBT14_09445 [Treponema sp.]|jgi:hypothetical protein|nr:hypothetical protein [Treponema sp.]